MPRKKSASAKKIWIIGGIIGASVIAAAVIALVASSGGASKRAGIEEFRPVRVSGASLPKFPEVGADPGLGLTAPSLSGQSFDGTAVKIGAGKPTLVVFVAHWCPHCRREVPLLVTWQAAGGVPVGLDVFGVSTEASSAQPNFPPSKWLGDEKFPWPVLVDDLDFAAAQAYGLPGFPYFVLTDAAGKVLWRGSGEIDPTLLAQTIAKLIKPA